MAKRGRPAAEGAKFTGKRAHVTINLNFDELELILGAGLSESERHNLSVAVDRAASAPEPTETLRSSTYRPALAELEKLAFDRSARKRLDPIKPEFLTVLRWLAALSEPSEPDPSPRDQLIIKCFEIMASAGIKYGRTDGAKATSSQAFVLSILRMAGVRMPGTEKEGWRLVNQVHAKWE